MSSIVQLIGQHGYLLLFAWVLAEQLGLPLPAMPALLAAGVLSGVGKLSFPVCIGTALLACLFGDASWFLLGRKYGARMVNLLCRVSLEPDTCVRKSASVFDRHGPQALLLVKFVPGVSAVSVPMAGNSAMTFRTFALYDVAGCAIYVLTVVSLGLLFAGSIERIHAVAAQIEAAGVVVVGGAVAGTLGRRVWMRRKFQRDVAMARISADELMVMMQKGEKPFVVDLRHPLDFLPHPQVIPTATRITPEELIERAADIPRDRDIILYCT